MKMLEVHNEKISGVEYDKNPDRSGRRLKPLPRSWPEEGKCTIIADQHQPNGRDQGKCPNPVGKTEAMLRQHIALKSRMEGKSTQPPEIESKPANEYGERMDCSRDARIDAEFPTPRKKE